MNINDVVWHLLLWRTKKPGGAEDVCSQLISISHNIVLCVKGSLAARGFSFDELL